MVPGLSRIIVRFTYFCWVGNVKVVRVLTWLSPPAWVAAPSLRLGHLLHLSMRLLGSQGEERETSDLEGATTRDTRSPCASTLIR